MHLLMVSKKISITNKSFVDTDILFRYFAINSKKYEDFCKNGTSGHVDIDNSLNVFQKIGDDNSILLLSEHTILELVCTLQRMNSSTKIPKIINQIYKIGEILPIENFELKLSWFLGSNYNLHTGDAYNASFCICNNLTRCYICDSKFYDSFNQIIADYKRNGNTDLIKFYSEIQFSEEVPRTFLQKLEHLENIQVIKV